MPECLRRAGEGRAFRVNRPSWAAVPDRTSGVSGAVCRGQCREDAALAPVAQGLGRVLVVDDDEVIRPLIAVKLTLEGFDGPTAVEGQDCLDRATAIDPDVTTRDLA